MNKIYKVLIVDDSQLICELLSSILSSDPRLRVVGFAKDPHQARSMIKDLSPDVITLDVEMPKMNGITFLKNLMRLHPLPVVMISTLTSEGSGVTLSAMETGAIDFIEKPSDLASDIDQYRDLVISKVLAAAQAPKAVLSVYQHRLKSDYEQRQQPAQPVSSVSVGSRNPEKIVAIGGSTGGLEALKELLLRANLNGNESAVIALHLPGTFTASYAARLDSVLPLTVKEAEDNERIVPGTVYIAPGGRHLLIKKRAVGYQCVLSDADRVNLHKPSVDVLFDSVAEQAGSEAVGMILTGMGKDGAQGLRHMRESGAYTYAQDQKSSVVWGMPGAAVALDAAETVTGLSEMGKAFTRFFTDN